MASFGFDLKQHLEYIVLGIVVITTAPVIIKLAGGKKKVKENAATGAGVTPENID